MSERRINRDSYMNLKGTTCNSFKIGQTSISFASGSVVNEPNEDSPDISKYKTLVCKSVGKEKVIYDMDIPMKSVKEVKKDNAGIVHFQLYDGTDIAVNPTISGIQSEVTDNATGQIVIFKDASGKVIKNSGFTFMESGELPSAGQVVDSLKKLNDLYKDWEPSDEKIPTMKAVVDYVGTVSSVLELRTAGELPFDNIE